MRHVESSLWPRGALHENGNWQVPLALAALVVCAVALRVPGLYWLFGAGPYPDYSFNGDDQRFLDLAKNFSAGLPDGYMHGMTTHLMALQRIAIWFGAHPSPLQLLKCVVLAYAGLTLLLVFQMARKWVRSPWTALLAACLVAVAPLHVVSSNFATADVPAALLFYLSIFLLGRYAEGRAAAWLVLAAVTVGVAIAVKFFIPLLVPLMLMPFFRRDRGIVWHVVVAVVGTAAGFECASLFAYSLEDARHFYAMLKNDNVQLAHGNGFIKQAALYVWDAIGGVGLPVAVIVAAKATQAALACGARAKSLGFAWVRQQLTSRAAAVDPTALLLVCGLATQGLLLLIAATHAARHLLVFVPATAMVAAMSIEEWLGKVPMKHRAIALGGVFVLLAYMGWNAVAVEELFVRDVRAGFVADIQQLRQRGLRVVTFHPQMILKGTDYLPQDQRRTFPDDTRIFSCDLEYGTYVRDREGLGTVTVGGGQNRQDFIFAALRGRDGYGIEKTVRQLPLSFEQWLIDRQWLRPMGTFVPKRCVLIGPSTSATLALGEQDIIPRFYYTEGW